MDKLDTNVCFVLPSLNSGGMENYLLRFLQWAKLGGNAYVVVKSIKGAELHDEYAATGARIEYRGISYMNPRRWVLFYLFLRQNNFRTICDFTGDFAGMALLLARAAGTPKRIAFYRRSSHGFHPSIARLWYASLANRLVYHHATRILSNSRLSLNFFFSSRTRRSSKFKVIYNGIDNTRFNASISKIDARKRLGIPEEAFVVGHVGRYDPAKNHPTIFETVRILKERIPNFLMVFCGAGTDGDLFRNAIAPYHIDDAVVALGSRRDVEILLRSLDVFFFPSITEGQPNALIEAMLSGIPIVASNIEAITEIVPEYCRDSMLVDPSDISEAVDRIITHYSGEVQMLSLIDYASAVFDISRNFDQLRHEL